MGKEVGEQEAWRPREGLACSEGDGGDGDDGSKKRVAVGMTG